MKFRLLWTLAAFGLAAAALASAQTTLPVGTNFKIELQSKLDSKKAKVGDKIVAKCSDNVKDHDTLLLPKGSLLTGHVTQVTPAAGDQPAQIGVLFDQATPKKGPALSFRAAIVKIYSDDANVAGMVSRPTEMGGSGVNMPLDAGNPAYASMDRASNGVPVQYSIQETAVGEQSDVGGVVISVRDNFTLDDGAHLQLRVLQPGH